MSRSPVSWLFACLFLLPGCNLSPPIYEDPGAAVEDLYVYCDDGTSCAPYEVCVTDGIVWCEGRSCWTDGHTNLSCVRDIGGSSYMPPPHPPDAGGYAWPDAGPPYMPPPMPSSMCSIGLRTPTSYFGQGAGRRMCAFDRMAEGRTYATGWANVICDVGPCTVQIVSATLYVPATDGRVIPISTGIGWTGIYDNFFRSSLPRTTGSPVVGSPNTYHVPRLSEDSVLHLGLTAVSIAGYSEAFVVMEIRTTGDAQVQVGIDYRWNPSDATVLEGAISDWASCNSGGTIRVASRRSSMDCGATLASVDSSPPPPMPMPPPSTSSNFVISLPPYGTAGCTAPITARAWGPSGEFNSSGSTLSFTVPSLGGIWWNMYCGGEAWGSRWGGTGARASSISGLSVRVNGTDRGYDTMICPNPGGSGTYWHMPVTYLDGTSGHCP